MAYDYPDDEFDELGAQRSVRGVHRRRQPKWRAFIPLITILIAAPLAGWGVVRLFSDEIAGNPFSSWGKDTQTQTAEPDEPETTTEEPSDSDSESDDGETSTSADPSETETTDTETTVAETTSDGSTAPDDVDMSIAVTLLNGAGIGGFAAEKQSVLEDEGFSNTYTGNYADEVPSETTVYYASVDDEATAQHIADLLGIDTTLMSPGFTDGRGIVVVLRSDIS